MAAAGIAEAWEQRTVHPGGGFRAAVSSALAVRPRKDEAPPRPLCLSFCWNGIHTDAHNANSTFARPSLDLRGCPYTRAVQIRKTSHVELTEGLGSELPLLRRVSHRSENTGTWQSSHPPFVGNLYLVLRSLAQVVASGCRVEGPVCLCLPSQGGDPQLSTLKGLVLRLTQPIQYEAGAQSMLMAPFSAPPGVPGGGNFGRGSPASQKWQFSLELSILVQTRNHLQSRCQRERLRN